ncbi:MAG: 50S ribosomal protein L3 [Candidatus Campbellbacteria bacterium]|nr:50S ribosomal protein L3 [Candidatus Campbellbacteria bacterium]
MKFLVGTKQEMTQVFDDNGVVHPATLIRVSPAVVTQIKTKDIDGYTAVQVGYDVRKEKNVNNAQKSKGMFAGFMEFPVSDPAELPLGTMIDAGVFTPGDTVTVSGTSKSKGFQGVVKRHGFKGGRRTHGQKHSEREPGSIGAGGVQRVMKGRRMGGRMGGDRITVKNLKVLLVDVANGQIFISGAVPGRRGTVVEVMGS